MRTLIVFNPISGSGRAQKRVEALVPVLEARGLGPNCLESQRKPVHEWLRLPAQDHDAVVLVGGDGLVHAVAPLCAEVDLPLLHDPAGTENLFAREISSSAQQQPPEKIADRLEALDVRHVDLIEMQSSTGDGEVKTEPMVIVGSVGIDADVVWAVDSARSGSITRWNYFRPILRSAFTWRGTPVTIVVDGEEVVRDEPAMVVLGNCRQYAGRLDPVRNAHMDSGMIDVVVLPAKTALGVAKYTLGCWLGGAHLRSRRVRYRTGKSVVMEFQRPVAWQIDGDPPPEKTEINRLVATVRAGVLPVVR